MADGGPPHPSARRRWFLCGRNSWQGSRIGPKCPHQWKGSTGCGHLHHHPLPVSPAVVSSHRQRLSGAIPHYHYTPSTLVSQPREASWLAWSPSALTAFQVAIWDRGWHGGGGGWGETSGCATLWGVVWPIEARILPMVANPQFPPVMCAPCPRRARAVHKRQALCDEGNTLCIALLHAPLSQA